MLVATCVGPCWEFEPQVAVVNRLDASLDARLAGQVLTDALPPGEASEFFTLSRGVASQQLVVQAGNVGLEVPLDRYIPSASESSCYVLFIEPCAQAPEAVCVTALQTVPDGHTLVCEAAGLLQDTDGGEESGEPGSSGAAESSSSKTGA